MTPTVADTKRKRRPVPFLAANSSESDGQFDDEEEDVENAVFLKPINSLLDTGDRILAKSDRFFVTRKSLQKCFLLQNGSLILVWEQMQLRNKPMLKHLNAMATAGEDDLEEEEGDGEDLEESYNEGLDRRDEGGFNENADNEQRDDGEGERRDFGNGRTTDLDDDFFSLHEMEKFAERGEARDIGWVKAMTRKKTHGILGRLRAILLMAWWC
ncbi:hypothetical protein BC830DRAFT_1215746 [Chytriomyces sp. MP71]|nr:hypothetical protein BC830DRAFT_1215746 [Chytriomyces sp. MP71]